MLLPHLRSTGRFLSLMGACVALAAAGCGNSEPKPTPVSGKVTVDGEPMTFGSVNYVPDTAKGNSTGQSAFGTLGDGGAYKLQAVPGLYKVVVTANAAMGAAAPTNPLHPNAKYADPGKTELSVEVKPDAPPGSYDLKLTK